MLEPTGENPAPAAAQPGGTPQPVGIPHPVGVKYPPGIEQALDFTGADSLSHAPIGSPLGIIYYGSGDIFVTDQYLVVAGRKVALRQLSHVHTRRASVSTATVNAAIAVGAGGVVLVIAGSMLDATAWAAAVIVLAVPLAVLLAGLLRRRPYELWADCQASRARDGEPQHARIVLLKVTDRERYRQICRALVRAQEHAGL
jgi:Family of unknown function (DUF6232)